MGAVMSSAAGARPRADQHGSRAEGVTVSAPLRCALDPSIAQSMECVAGVAGTDRGVHLVTADRSWTVREWGIPDGPIRLACIRTYVPIVSVNDPEYGIP
jgi:hypothetical protein